MLRDDTPSRRDQAGLWKTNPLRATRYVETTPDSVLEQHEVVRPEDASPFSYTSPGTSFQSLSQPGYGSGHSGRPSNQPFSLNPYFKFFQITSLLFR